MENEKFIPELHDIGKLVSDELKSKLKIHGHTFTFDKFNFEEYKIEKPVAPSWWGQYHHKRNEKNLPDDWGTEDDIKNWRDIPDEYKGDLFILILSDHLAASSSRSTLEIRGYCFTPNEKQAGNMEIQKSILRGLGIDKMDKIEGVIKLWNKKYYQEEESKGNQWVAFGKDDDIKKIFDEIQNCQSGEKFLGKYEKYLKLTPEDKSLPSNITSLYTHLELVGKIYRVLKKCTRFKKNDEEFVIRLNDPKEVKSIKEAEGGKRTISDNNDDIKKGKWQARLVKCHIGFYQSFVRLHDVNIFKKRDGLINDLLIRYRDNVLFYTSDFVELFLTSDEDLYEIFQGFTDAVFYVKCIETTADLGILKSNLDDKILKAKKDKYENVERIKVLEERKTKVKMKIIAKTPESVLKSGICEVCQHNEHLEEPWLHENVKEWICQSCWDIRDLHEPFSEYYNEWQGEKVCWFKFKLDQDKLEKWLQKSFVDYVEMIHKHYDLKGKDILISEFRPLAPQVDFNIDYRKLLSEFWMALEENTRIKKPIAEYDELGVFLYSAELTVRIIRKYLSLIEKYFPDCVHNEESPISLSLSFANIKYPVREHWRFFETDNKNFLNIHSQNIYKGSYSMIESQIILEIVEKSVSSPVSKSALHDIIQAFEKLSSEIELTLRLKDKSADVYHLYVNEGILPERFLQMYKILGGGE